MDIIRKQYGLLQSSRSALFNYCRTVSPTHFVKPVEVCAHRSMRDLLHHVARASLFWIGEFALKKTPSPSMTRSPENMDEMRALYDEVDILVLEYISAHEDSWERPISGFVNQNRSKLTVSALQVVTHIITHEFHHKGQILSISRLLGYSPVDTDVIRL